MLGIYFKDYIFFVFTFLAKIKMKNKKWRKLGGKIYILKFKYQTYQKYISTVNKIFCFFKKIFTFEYILFRLI